MRLVGLAVLLCAVGVGDARADQKIKDFIPGLEREHGACTTQVAGMLKVATGADRLAKAATNPTDKADLEKAAAALAKGHVAVADYCTEVGAFVAYLKANADAVYKTVEREIDTRHTKVGNLRREAKRLVDELQPTTRKLIPRITKLTPPTPDGDKKMTNAKFPSGRAIDLPVMPGAWKLSGSATSDVVEYTDKTATAIVTTRAGDGDCVASKKVVPKDADQLADVSVPKQHNVAWAVTYVRRESSGALTIVAMCADRGASSMLAIANLRVDATLRDTMMKVALAMLAARK